jgi:F-type H+-transporting ATPase subunit delta
MKDSVVAKKYAHALFAEAQAKKELRAAQQGLEEFIRIARLRGSLKLILAHPFIAVEEKKRMIRSALGEYATPLLERFLFLLVSKRRLDLLFLIALEFQDEIDRFMKVQSLRVKSAFPMSESQQKELQGRLEKWLNSKVRMDVQVDSSLIGGLVIQTRDHVLDQSLKGQLKKLEGVFYGHSF